jgi:hypothetical protein
LPGNAIVAQCMPSSISGGMNTLLAVLWKFVKMRNGK